MPCSHWWGWELAKHPPHTYNHISTPPPGEIHDQMMVMERMRARRAAAHHHGRQVCHKLSCDLLQPRHGRRGGGIRGGGGGWQAERSACGCVGIPAEFRMGVLESRALLRSAVLRRPCWRRLPNRLQLLQNRLGLQSLPPKKNTSVVPQQLLRAYQRTAVFLTFASNCVTLKPISTFNIKN